MGFLQATVLEWVAVPSSGARIAHVCKSATISQARKGKAITIKIILLTEFAKELGNIISKYDNKAEENV